MKALLVLIKASETMVGRTTQLLQTAKANKDRAHDVMQRMLAMQQAVLDEDDDSKKPTTAPIRRNPRRP